MAGMDGLGSREYSLEPACSTPLTQNRCCSSSALHQPQRKPHQKCPQVPSVCAVGRFLYSIFEDVTCCGGRRIFPLEKRKRKQVKGLGKHEQGLAEAQQGRASIPDFYSARFSPHGAFGEQGSQAVEAAHGTPSRSSLREKGEKGERAWQAQSRGHTVLSLPLEMYPKSSYTS